LNANRTNICKNCASTASEKYCPNCGQKTAVDRISFKETIQDFIESTFSINAPFLITLKFLITDPGRLFREFLEGKRKRYYKPVAFFILMSVLYLLVRSLIEFDPFGDTSVIAVGDDPKGEALDRLTRARNFMLINIDKLLFFFVFTLSLLLKGFFYKKNSLAEFVAIAFYVIGVYTLLTTLNMFYIQYANSEMQALAILFFGVYFVYAMISYFKHKKFWVGLKSIVVFFSAMFLYIALAFSFSYAFVTIKN
jgi:hypothetical protein